MCTGLHEMGGGGGGGEGRGGGRRGRGGGTSFADSALMQLLKHFVG